jgi:hypothetical protein
MKEGDLIRVLRVPAAVMDSEEFQTRSILERCVGRTFSVMGLNEEGMIQIDVGELTGKEPYLESIWIEADCVEFVVP